jgi:hypothetical protein
MGRCSPAFTMSQTATYAERENVPSLHGNTLLYGIFGYPIGHSLSPLMHNTAFAYHGLDAVYLPFGVHPAHIDIAVR